MTGCVSLVGVRFDQKIWVIFRVGPLYTKYITLLKLNANIAFFFFFSNCESGNLNLFAFISIDVNFHHH